VLGGEERGFTTLSKTAENSWIFLRRQRRRQRMATTAADNGGGRRLDFSSMAMAAAADGDCGGCKWQ
jgi:hypothetical protein